MHRIAVALIVPLLVWPALADDEKTKDQAKEKAKSTQAVPAAPLTQKSGGPEPAKPGTPAAEYRALMKEYSEAQEAYTKAYQDAKDEDKPKLHPQNFFKLIDKSASKFLELAEKHPKDSVAVDALAWVVSSQNGRSAANNSLRSKAIAILQRDYITSEKIGSICQSLGYQIYDPQTEPLLRAILDKNPSSAVKGDACLALAQGLLQQSQWVRMMATNPEVAKGYEQSFGKEYVEALRKKDADKLDAEREQLYGRFADQYLAELKPDRLASMFQTLSYSVDEGSKKLLRTLMEKDKRREVQGVATLTLAQVLKRQADAQAGESGDKIRKESESLLELAIEKYADVQMQYYGTVGKKAKGELHALRFLAIGKPAPEVEGVDQDGKKFKLSDYKGKVVLLDFWSQY
jgi:hypothetical protein